MQNKKISFNKDYAKGIYILITGTPDVEPNLMYYKK